MKSPKAPHLEIGFYFGRRPEDLDLVRLAAARLSLGGVVPKSARVIHLPDGRRVPFGLVGDIEGAVDVDLQSSLDPLRDRSTQQVLAIQLEGSEGRTSDTEIAECAWITPAAIEFDAHPVQLVLDGSALFGGEGRIGHARAQARGRHAYRLAQGLANSLKPRYGSINLEYTMECPFDLEGDSLSLGFRSFVLHNSLLRIPAIAAACADAADRGAFVERWTYGLYVSTTPSFGPRPVSVPQEYAQDLSVRVGRLIARHVPQGGGRVETH